MKYPITVEEFKSYFDRDFAYSLDDMDSVRDKDIIKAMGEAKFTFNESLFSEEPQKKLGFLYLTAHYLCIDLENSSKGLGSKFEGIMTSKSVGSVSVGYQLPEWIMSSPIYSMLGQTGYGCKYLSLVIPQMVGNMYAIKGTTLP